MKALRDGAIDHLSHTMEAHVADGSVAGLAWLVSRRGEVRSGAAGTFEPGGAGPRVDQDTIFRIASLTKPIVSAATLALVEQCRLRLDDPVDPWLPELADPRVLADPSGPLDETVPAERPISLRDLLTCRMGLGYDFGGSGSQPALAALAAGGYPMGPPEPQRPLTTDRFAELVGSIPLERQPGERWLYHVSSDVLGVLVARVTGRPLEDAVRELVLDPLGLDDTGFAVPPAKLDRFGPCYSRPPEGDDGEVVPVALDEAGGQWSAPPVFASGGGGMVSTVTDFARFAAALLGGGRLGSDRILSRPSVEAMTMDHLTDAQRAASSPDPSGTVGWGFGVGVRSRRIGPTETVGSYGWTGGLGSSWTTDPNEELTVVLLTNEAFSGPFLPPVHQDIVTCAYAAIDD